MFQATLLTTLCVSVLATNAEDITTNSEGLAELRDMFGYLWLLVCGALVMFMQAGFTMLESGTCRAKHAATVLMKNVLDAGIGTVVWYFWGYGLAYGVEGTPNNVIGISQFAGSGFDKEPRHYRDWFFQWAFCVTSATIVSGAVAERAQFTAYCLFSVVMTGVIYPVIVYWTWSGEGFLTEMGYSDFAGSGVVHMTGGIAALVGATLVGPRNGRWTSDPARFNPHNMGSVVLGTFILWFGWYGFNCGSTLAFDSLATAHLASLVAMNTTLSAAAGGVAVFVVRYLRLKSYDLAGCCNGILAGLVVVCAEVGDVHPSVAFASGLLGGLAMEGGHLLTQKLRIDDPLDAFAVHGCGGIAGVLIRPLFDKNGFDSEMFAAHVLGIVCIGAWSAGLTAVVFGSLKLANRLRISDSEERTGTNMELSAPHMYRASTIDMSRKDRDEDDSPASMGDTSTGDKPADEPPAESLDPV